MAHVALIKKKITKNNNTYVASRHTNMDPGLKTGVCVWGGGGGLCSNKPYIRVHICNMYLYGVRVACPPKG